MYVVEPAWRASFVGWRDSSNSRTSDPFASIDTSNWSRIPPGGADSSYNPLPTAV